MIISPRVPRSRSLAREVMILTLIQIKTMNEITNIEPEHQGRLSFRRRLFICLGIVLIGMTCACPHPGAIIFAPFYPVGLDRFLGSSSASGGGVVGYSVFAIAIPVILCVSRKLPFTVLCFFLAVICGMTSSGCHRVLEGLKGIT